MFFVSINLIVEANVSAAIFYVRLSTTTASGFFRLALISTAALAILAWLSISSLHFPVFHYRLKVLSGL